MANISLITVVIVAVSSVNLATIRATVPNAEWNNYKATHNKVYDSIFKEAFAKLNYAANKEIIRVHNALYMSGLVTYDIAINQFSDMNFIQLAGLFPPAIYSPNGGEKPPPAVQPAADSYDPREMGFKLNVGNQGTTCSSGWAYAAAKSIELFKALRMDDKNNPPLSAQNLIDCAGGTTACKSQVTQTAFDYLTQYNKSLHLEDDYKNENNANKPGMCTPPANVKQVVTLNAYSKIKDYDDEALKSYVSAGMPVVVEFNPASFFFMHYSKGIFQQPTWKLRGSHFMIVIGYDTDKATNMTYWLLQNSFGTTWGEEGLLKLERSSGFKITNNAIFPSEL